MISSFVRKLKLILAVFVLLILIAAAGWRIYGNSRLQRAVDRYHKEAGPTDSSAYAPSKVGETENAAVWLQAGTYAFVMTSTERGFLGDLISTPLEKWDAKSTDRLREILQRNDHAYQILANSVSLEESSFNLDYSRGMDMEIPKLLYFVQAQRILGCKARLYLIAGDTAQALQTMAIEERMAAALLHEPILISCLVGEVAQKDYDALVQEILLRTGTAMLPALERQLSHLRGMEVPLSRIVASEGALKYGTMLHKYPEETGSFVSVVEIPSNPLPRLVHLLNRRLFLAILLDSHADFAKASADPFAKRTPYPSAPGWEPNQVVRDAVLPNFYDAIERVQATESEQNLAELAVKVARKAALDRAYPADLSKLLTPVSPYSGEPVHYEIQSDGSVVLSYPEADRLWEQTRKNAVPRKPLFIWKLPALPKS